MGRCIVCERRKDLNCWSLHVGFGSITTDAFAARASFGAGLNSSRACNYQHNRLMIGMATDPTPAVDDVRPFVDTEVRPLLLSDIGLPARLLYIFNSDLY
jgi:hypothetical protein